MHTVPANYLLPTVLSTLPPVDPSGLRKTVNARASAATTTGSTSSSSSNAGLGSTFLNLLATELQNQDPTAPVDSTAMVGQMISLNQLDQLIKINHTLGGSAGTGTTGSLQPASAAAGNASAANGLSPSVAGAAANQLPFNPDTMMPLNFRSAGAVGAAMIPSLDSSTTGNTTSGGK